MSPVLACCDHELSCRTGKQIMPFAETFWSPGYGSLIDRFGVPWMVNTVPAAGWKPAHA